MVKLIILILVTSAPFLWLITQSSVLGMPVYVFANISGFLGTIFLLWQFLLGIRGIAKILFGNLAVPLKLHQMLGVYGMFFILIHPVAEMISYGEKILFLVKPEFGSNTAFHITFGRFAIFLLLFVFVSSALVREKLSRKIWIWIHYSSYLTMPFVFIHALDIGTFIRTFPLIKYYWYFLIGIYAIVILWRIILIIIGFKTNKSPPQTTPNPVMTTQPKIPMQL